jgi:glucose-1-phosphate thymidylyltransferase
VKGVVLAGGLGTRLYPLTYATSKQLLPVYDKPMIYYPLQTLVRAGVDDIMVVTGGPHAGDFIRVLRNGRHFGVRHLEYTYQENPEGGLAEALGLCEEYVGDDSVAFILGDNTTDADIGPAVERFAGGAMVFLKEVPDPQRFGCPVFARDDPRRIVRIEEKPPEPASPYAVTGLYLYDAKVFDYIRTIERSPRGQLEITDVNNGYLRDGALSWELLDGFWSDAGTFESLYRASKYWAEKALGDNA